MRAACCSFPVDDVGAHMHRAIWLGPSQGVDVQPMLECATSWHPFAGRVYFHVRLERLEDTAGLHAQGDFAETIDG